VLFSFHCIVDWDACQNSLLSGEAGLLATIEEHLLYFLIFSVLLRSSALNAQHHPART